MGAYGAVPGPDPGRAGAEAAAAPTWHRPLQTPLGGRGSGAHRDEEGAAMVEMPGRHRAPGNLSLSPGC